MYSMTRLHPYLSNKIQVAEGSHVRMAPSMHGNVITSIKCLHKLLRIPYYLRSYHEMRRCLIIALKELQQPRSCL